MASRNAVAHEPSGFVGDAEHAEPSEKAARRLLHRRGVPRLAAALDLDRILGPPVGLVELAGLRIAEHDPVADVFPSGSGAPATP
jgi:hypothetical protein